MTQAVDSQPVQPLISPRPPSSIPAEHGFGSSVHLDVIDPPPRMKITETSPCHSAVQDAGFAVRHHP